MKNLLSKRKLNTHKGSYGRVGIIAGSKGMTGAAYLACQSALRTGSGLVYSIVPETIERVMSIKLTEAIIKPIEDGGKGHFTNQSTDDILKEILSMDVLALGPGMGVDDDRVELVGEIIASSKLPIVIDADGLNCVSKNIIMLNKAKSPLIVTPHLGEMARLLGIDIKVLEKDKEYYGKYFSFMYDVITILKGHNTMVVSPEGQIYINKTGNPGMATGGSGDVLTGIVTSLIGQGLKPYDASCLGVYFHGLAGDIARDKLGEYSILAGDILEAIPYALLEYFNNKD